MSNTHNLVCLDCLKYLWVAQRGSSSDVFYSGDEDIMDALGKFLFEHRNHHLTFTDIDGLPDNCEEVEVEKKRENQVVFCRWGLARLLNLSTNAPDGKVPLIAWFDIEYGSVLQYGSFPDKVKLSILDTPYAMKNMGDIGKTYMLKITVKELP